MLNGPSPDLVVVAVDVLVDVVVLLAVELVVCERDCVLVLELVAVPVELIVPRGVVDGRLLEELDLVPKEERVLEAVLEEERVFLPLLEVVAVAEDERVPRELLEEDEVGDPVFDIVLEAVWVLELVTVRLDVVEAVEVLLLVEVLVLVPEAVELLELVDVLDVVVVLVDVKLAREDGVGGREGTAVSLGLPLLVELRVELADLVGRALAPNNSLGPKGAQDG